MRRNILIIEDDPGQADALQKRLAREGMNCQHAATFAAGLALTGAQHFDCVIADLGLPDSDLETEHETVRRLPELGAQVVVYTGSGDPNLFGAVRATGAAIVMKGPGSIEFLIYQLHSQLNYNASDKATQVAQQEAQRRLQQEPVVTTLDEGTKVRLSISQMAWLTGSIVSATVAAVVYLQGLSGRVDVVGEKVDALTVTVESAQRGTTARVDNYGRWRDKVNINFRRLGSASNVQLEALEDHP